MTKTAKEIREDIKELREKLGMGPANAKKYEEYKEDDSCNNKNMENYVGSKEWKKKNNIYELN